MYSYSQETEQVVKILESSKDYMNESLLIIFEGDYSEQTLLEYVSRNYPINGLGIYQFDEVSRPTEFKGLRNPGTVSVKIVEFTFTQE